MTESTPRWTYHLSSAPHVPGVYELRRDGVALIGVSIMPEVDRPTTLQAILHGLEHPPEPQGFQGAARAWIEQWCGTWWYSDRLGFATNHVHQCIGTEHPESVAHTCRCGAIHPTPEGATP